MLPPLILPLLLLGVPASVVGAPANSTVLNATTTATPAPVATGATEGLPTSPFVGPTPETRGEGAWSDAVQKARARIADWSVEAKVNLTTGVGFGNSRCVGNIGAQPDLGFDGLCLQDSPMGVARTDFVSSFPDGINSASTFDRKLIRERGLAMGQEFRGKGVNIALGPMTNMVRLVEAGRNWEGFGEDPYLSGEATYETIIGMQTPGQGTQACVKHHIGNEQETARFTSSSNIDDRTIHEIYLHPFLKAIQADVATVMCSYNKINGTWACENSKVQNDLLKYELGFQGPIITDWGGQHSLEASINGGLDMSMPSGIRVKNGTTYDKEFVIAVQNGSIPIERLDDMAIRILAGYYLLEQDQPEFPPVNFNSNKLGDPLTDLGVDVQADHAEGIRKMGAASTVLLKNTNGALPLGKDIRKIALIGDDAGPARRGLNEGGSAGASGAFGPSGGADGILAQGRGSGSNNYPYLISPLEAIQAKSREAGSHVSVSWFLDNYDLAGANRTAIRQDAALVFLSEVSGEGADRANITVQQNGDALVNAVAAVNNNTIVVIHSVGPIDMESWVDHENVTAIVWAGLPGQEAGNSLVDVLYGAYNPSGRMPYTIAKKMSDYPAQLIPVASSTPLPTETPSTDVPQVDYTEKLNLGYRHFLANNITPRYGFGFGLSYTTFGYGGLEVVEHKMSKRDWEDEQKYSSEVGFAGEVGSSVAPWLHAKRYSVEFDVTNTGDVYGCDVPQMYLKFPEGAGEPPKVLRGFERVTLSPGETARVRMPLSQYEMSIWDVVQQKWVKPEGTFGVVIGQSAFDTQLEGSI